MRRRVWDEVKDLVKAGEEPQISISPGARVMGHRRRPEKPKRPPNAPEAYGWKTATPTGNRMRCRRPGCQKKLRRDSVTLTCGPQCQAALLDQVETTAKILRGELALEDFPMAWRMKNRTKRAA